MDFSERELHVIRLYTAFRFNLDPNYLSDDLFCRAQEFMKKFFGSSPEFDDPELRKDIFDAWEKVVKHSESLKSKPC